MIVMTNGTEYIYKTNSIRFRKQRISAGQRNLHLAKAAYFYSKMSRQPRAFMPTTQKNSVFVIRRKRKRVFLKPQE